MTLRRPLALVLALLAAAPACATPAVLAPPPPGPGTEYPCGVDGQVCPNSDDCCAEDEVCGFSGDGSTCPAGYCCDAAGSADLMMQRRPPRKARKAWSR